MKWRRLVQSLAKRDLEVATLIVDSEDYNKRNNLVEDQIAKIYRKQLWLEADLGIYEEVLNKQLEQNQGLQKDLNKQDKLMEVFLKVIIVLF